MTCIVAVKIKNEIAIGGDTLGSNGFNKTHYTNKKVFSNGEFTIGYTTSFIMGQVLEHLWRPPARMEGTSTQEYLIVDVIPSIRQCFSNNGINEHKDGLNEGGSFILVFEGDIYEVQPDYSIMKSEQDFVSVGSGTYHASACASTLLKHNNKLKLTAEQIVVESIKTASSMVTSVGGEVFTLKIGGK